MQGGDAMRWVALSVVAMAAVMAVVLVATYWIATGHP